MTSWFDFLKTAALHVSLTIGLWTIACTLIGSLVGFFVHIGLGRLGAWRLGWPHVKWWRVLTCIWLVVLFGFLAGAGGGLEGFRRSIRYLLKAEPVRRELLLPLGRVGATTLAYFHCRIGGSREEAVAFVREFQKGKQEIPVRTFTGRVSGLANTGADTLSHRTVGWVQSRARLAETHWFSKFLKKSTDALFRRFFREVLQEKVVGICSSNGLEQFLDTLPAAGAAGGNTASLSFEEAALHVVDHGIHPMIMSWVNGLILYELLLLVAGLLFFALLPVATFWILRLLEGPATDSLRPPESTTDH